MTAWLVRAFGVLLMLSALFIALARAPDRPVETLVARWALPPSDFVEVKGMVVHLRDEGPRGHPDAGPPLLLLHGTGASLHTWEGWVRALKTSHRVISIDLPGFGLTGPFAGQYAAGDYRGDNDARFVLDLLDVLQLPRVVIAGNGLGGEVAWRTATLAPQRVAGLVLVAADGLPATTPHAAPAVVPISQMLARLPVLNHIGEWLLPRPVVAQDLALMVADPAQVTTELIDRTFELTLREGNRQALGQRLRQAVPGQDAGRINTVRQPTLILWGGRDRINPPSAAQAFQQRIAGSQLVVFDALGHLPQEEDPAATAAAVKAFLR